MSDYLASTQVVTQPTPVSIPTARKYLGCVLNGLAAADSVSVYRGNSVVAANLIGYVKVSAVESGDDAPGFPVMVDPSTLAVQGIHVVVAGNAGAIAIVRYNT